jgi:hypothetical protein
VTAGLTKHFTCETQQSVAFLRRFSRAQLFAALSLVAVLFVATFVRFRNVGDSLPYIRHVDEQTEANVALGMLRDGTTNPRRFNKPTLPAYVIAASFWVGGLGEPENRYRRVETTYPIPAMAAFPKLVFAAASVLALGLLGIAGAVALGRMHLLWLAPLCSSVAATYLNLSWSYLNVDILGATFAMATVTFLALSRSGALRSLSGSGVAAVAGVLAGFTVGCKYNLFPIVVPCVLELWFLDRRTFPKRFVLLGFVSLAAFLVTTPYALFDSRAFLQDALREAHHYATGHLGTSLDPGIPVLGMFGGLLIDNFGPLPLVVAVVGAALIARRDVRAFAILFAFPLVFTLYMSLQRVFFERNAVSLPLFVGLALAYALVQIPALVARELAKKPRLASLEKALRGGVTVALAALVVVGLPWRGVSLAYRDNVESRSEAIRWISDNVASGTRVFVDGRLAMDARRLERDYRVIVLEGKRAVVRAVAPGGNTGAVLVLKAPDPKREEQRMLPEKGLRFGTHRSTRLDPRLEIHRL